MKTLMQSLLADWCDGLLRQQINAPGDEKRHGGLLCPDCGFIHGRCGDALYPFLRRARETGDEKWVAAAIAVQKWSDTVSRDDGAFVNDVPGNPWDGITVFATLSLAEALHFHGALLPETARLRWTNRLERAARWINGVDWSDHGTINYPLSAAAALASAFRVLGDDALLQTARRWGAWAQSYFLPDGVLYGEGVRTPTARGVYAVDALYNVEESLPNLALYAEIAGDADICAHVLRAFEAHLDFLLPDGSYDAGWGSRSFKWTLWGSRTSDGIAGLLPYTRFDARIAEAVWRNVEYLRSCTFDGLLYGGPHLRAHGRAPCIHHTFAHAKALAAALDGDCFMVGRMELPSDAPRGIWSRAPLGVTLVSVGEWRASFATSDVIYRKQGGHASGGAPTMLWRRDTGPLCVSSMSRYERFEATNMAATHSENDVAVLTARVEVGAFSSALDHAATLETSANVVTAHGHLTDFENATCGAFTLETRFEDDAVHFRATSETPGAMFVLPVVSQGDEIVEWADRRVVIRKAHADVICECDQVIRGDAARIFNFVPGVQAVRLAVEVPPDGVRVVLRVAARAS